MQSKKTERKCIGVYIAKADREYQTGILCGIYKAAFEHDMNVAVFCAMLAGGVATEKETELDIFTIPNFDKLSGIIYVPDAFDYKHTDEVIVKPLVKAVREKRIHAVSIGGSFEGIPSVEFDDTDTTRGILDHVIKHHGCRDIAFMTGRKGDTYAESRLELYKQIMTENGLPLTDSRMYYGDFWYNEGENFVRQLTDSEQGLPEAIVCANSYMACSIYRALRKFGYYIPKDVIVACQADEAAAFKYITSTSSQASFKGYASCQRLIEMIDGIDSGEKKPPVKCDFSINASLTCGCLPTEHYDHSKMEGIDVNEPQSYFSEFNFMSTDLLSRAGFREMFWTLDWYTTYIPNTDGIYFCMCEGWEKPCNDEVMGPFDEEENKTEYDPSQRVGFTERMQPYYYRINHSDGTHDSIFECNNFFPLSDMFPKLFDPSGEPSSYIFRSLHFVDSNFGYIVIDNGTKMQTYDIALDYWLKNVANAMEYQRKLGNEKYLYSSDFMTGLINRNGFNRMMPGIINEAKRGNYQLLFAVCDMNGLKYINDTFGHIEGDNGIKTAANALAASDFPHLSVEKNFRIGGDEFIKVVIGRFTYEEVEEFKRKVYNTLDKYNKSSGKPYPVYLSIGAIVKDPDEEYSVDSLISEADKAMYTDKQRIKKLTGFDPKRSF